MSIHRLPPTEYGLAPDRQLSIETTWGDTSSKNSGTWYVTVTCESFSTRVTVTHDMVQKNTSSAK